MLVDIFIKFGWTVDMSPASLSPRLKKQMYANATTLYFITCCTCTACHARGGSQDSRRASFVAYDAMGN